MDTTSRQRKTIRGDNILITREKADFILRKIEPDIQSVSKYFPIGNRDEISQEIRIKIWEIMKNSYKDKEAEDLEIIQFCKDQIYSISILSSKPINRAKNKYDKRHENIDNIEIPVSFEDNLHSKIDYDKYKCILTDKEFKMLKYLFSIGYDFSNYDFMSRQFGYTGKGASKYFIMKIAQKIKEYNEQNKNSEV